MSSFASDNYAGVPPEVLDALAAANEGSVVSYGDDPLTARAQAHVPAPLRGRRAGVVRHDGHRAPTSWASRRVCRSWEAVVTPATSHLHVDECGAPEQLGGLKLLAVPTPGRQARPRAGHRAPDAGSATSTRCSRGSSRSPRAPSWARSTRPTSCARWPTSPTRTACCSTSTARGWPTPRPRSAPRLARDHDRRRRRPRCASAGRRPALLAAEAVVFLRPRPGRGLRATLRKQHGQLASKIRFVSAQLDALLGDRPLARARPSTPTRWRGAWPRAWPTSRRCA